MVRQSSQKYNIRLGQRSQRFKEGPRSNDFERQAQLIKGLDGQINSFIKIQSGKVVAVASSGVIPSPLSVIRINFLPPARTSTLISVELASRAFSINFHSGKPPALPGDSRSLTFPGIDRAIKIRKPLRGEPLKVQEPGGFQWTTSRV